MESIEELAPQKPSGESFLVASLKAAVRPIGVVALALLIGMGIILYTQENPFIAYQNLLIAPFQSWDTFSNVLFYAIPLVLTGLATLVSFRANVFNIGTEGQLQLGALVTAWGALTFSGLPAVVLVPFIIALGALAGMIWSGIAGWMRAYLGATELVSTLMMSYIAIDITTYFVTPGGPLAGPGGATNLIPLKAQFPTIGNELLHWGIIVPILAVIAVYLLLYRTPLGYEIRMVGANPSFALFGGVPVPRVILATSLITGILAGVAGAVQVMGFAHQYATSFTDPQWGWTGVTVALLARLEPIGVVVAALLYALLEEGTQLMQNNTNVDHNIIGVVQGLIILFVTAQIAVAWLRRRRASATPAVEAA